MENISMTRISDLPEINGGGQSNKMGDSSYMPINVHPNPYGLPQHAIGSIPPQLESQSTQQERNQPQNIMYMANDYSEQQQRLPQRDIPRMPDNYTHDEQIQANYIPKPKKAIDYIDDYEETTNKKLRQYENKKMNDEINETWMDEMQIPVIISLIYFIFQMPIINTLLFKKFSFLSIYNDDGNFNFYGLLLKSVLFGSVFYTLQKSMVSLSNFFA